jgi:hypothetical protein
MESSTALIVRSQDILPILTKFARFGTLNKGTLFLFNVYLDLK